MPEWIEPFLEPWRYLFPLALVVLVLVGATPQLRRRSALLGAAIGGVAVLMIVPIVFAYAVITTLILLIRGIMDGSITG